MGQEFLLNCSEGYSYKSIKCLNIFISVLTVSIIKTIAIKRYTRCVEIKLRLYLAQDIFNPVQGSKYAITKKTTCKHYGTHSCLLEPAVRIKRRIYCA